MAQVVQERVYKHAHFFCGLGGGARGFNKGRARVGNLEARYRCIGGIDVDPASIRDFQRLAGVPGTLMDLFSLEQYLAFHGKAPPPGWAEALPDDIRRAFGYEFPDVVFLSAPCKGFSGLLAEQQSKTDKYQALNGLTLRGVFLMCEAFKDDPPALIIFENVPRIAKRGRYLVDQISGLLRGYGYAVNETNHNCGEIGGLAQSRERFLMVARYQPKVPNFLYEPPKRPLRGVGEVLDRMPLPGDVGRGGPMHRVPALQWKTWVRLAFVEAGKDWRSLNKLEVEDGFLKDFAIAPETSWRDGTLGVIPYDQAAGVVTAQAEPTTGRFSVADPKTINALEGSGHMGVRQWDEAAGTITGDARPSRGAFGVADPRVDGHDKSVQLGVRPWEKPAGVVTGKMFAGGGPNSVADPRFGSRTPFNNVFRIVPANAPSPAVAGPGGTGLCVADPRGDENRHVNGKYRITAYDEPSLTVISGSTTGNGAFALADPRVDGVHHGVLGVLPFDEPVGVVQGASRVTNGTFAVADPRPTHGPDAHTNKHKVIAYEAAAPTVTGSDRVGSGALSVADPRPNGLGQADHYGVLGWEQPSGTVTGSSHGWDNGRFSVADPRPAGLQGKDQNSYGNQGHYGVIPWEQPCWSVTAHGQADNGKWSVADKRIDLLPGLAEQLVCIIIARDGTWHRPFTTLELAALQSLYDPEDVLELDGRSDSAWRERIGNAVPSAAAEAIAGVMAMTLLLAETGETFSLSNDSIWVRQLQIGLSVDVSGQVPA